MNALVLGGPGYIGHQLLNILSSGSWVPAGFFHRGH